MSNDYNIILLFCSSSTGGPVACAAVPSLDAVNAGDWNSHHDAAAVQPGRVAAPPDAAAAHDASRDAAQPNPELHLLLRNNRRDGVEAAGPLLWYVAIYIYERI